MEITVREETTFFKTSLMIALCSCDTCYYRIGSYIHCIMSSLPFYASVFLCRYPFMYRFLIVAMMIYTCCIAPIPVSEQASGFKIGVMTWITRVKGLNGPS